MRMIHGREIQGVLFDVDGTLIDSNDAHAMAFVEAFARTGFSVAFESIRPLIGMGSDKLIPEILGAIGSERSDRDTIQTIEKSKGRVFRTKYLSKLRPFPKARDLVYAMRDSALSIGVATSGSAEDLQALLKIAGLGEAFDVAVCAGTDERSKPDPDLIVTGVESMRLSPAQVLMIGDTPYDILAANRAGCPAIGVECGGWPEEDLRGAIAVYEGPWDLWEEFLAAQFPLRGRSSAGYAVA